MSLLLPDTDDDVDVDADSNPEDHHGPNLDTAGASFQNLTREHEGRGGDSLRCRGSDDPLESIEPDDNSRLVFLRGGPWTATEERRLCLAVRAISTFENPGEDDHRRKEQGKTKLGGGETGTGVCSHDYPSKTGLNFPKISRKRARSEEHQKLDWGEVSWLMKGTRSDQQCRKKWVECIDPSVKRGAWDEAEDEELLRCES